MTVATDEAGRGASVERRSPSGDVVGTVTLDPAVFGVEVNVPLMHQVVTAQMAARRAGTQNTRTRAEVKGGASKPYRQKGTGRARQGSIRAPQWSGGGVALGPKPRSYAQRTPRKMVQLALRSALSDRAAEGRVVIVERFGFSGPRTKEAVALLAKLGVEGRVLVVLGADDVVAERCFANLPNVDLVYAGQLNAHAVVRSDYLLFSEETLPGASSFSDDLPPGVPASAAPATTDGATETETAGGGEAEAAGASETEAEADETAEAPVSEEADAEAEEAVEPAVPAAVADEDQGDATEAAESSAAAGEDEEDDE
jgi:large subunit ribosomal protein L4